MKQIRFLSVLLLLAVLPSAALAQVRSNRLVIPDIEAPSGRTVQIPVNLENTSDIIALQFDLTLPDGISASGQDDVSLTLRSENHTVTARNINGKLRVMVFSPDNSPIRGNGGALLYINVTIPGDLAQGTEHQLVISDAMLSDETLSEALTGIEVGKIIVTPSADLMPTAITLSRSSAAPGDEVTVNWTVRNVGSLPTGGGWRENVYVQRGDNKTLIGTLYNDASLPAGGETARSLTVTLPDLLGVDGNADVVVKVTPNSDAAEPVAAQGNNTGRLPAALALSKKLMIVAPQSLAENGSRSVRCTLSRSGNTRAEHTYTLSLSGPGDAGRIMLPPTVKIKFGDASAFFDIAINNDNLVNNSGEYVITASGNGYDAVSVPFILEDDEKPALDLEFPAEIDENGVTEGQTFTARVISDYPAKSDATINIFSERPDRFNYPSSVVLPAGETSVSFQITATQNDLIQGDSSTQFAVSAEGFIKGTEILTLKDDDIPSIQLTITPTTVNENAGYYAMEASLKRTSNLNTRATIKLSDNSHGALLYDKTFVMGKGVEELQFSIGVLDDANVNGERTFTVKAGVWLSSCSCTAGSQSGGEVQVDVTVLDDDGHALRLAVDRGTWLEGGSGTLTLSHNAVGGLPADLPVSLSSDYDSMLEYEHQVVIPAGQTSIKVPVAVKRNSEEGDNCNVTFTAQAAAFTKGVIWVQVSDQTIPDATVTQVSIPDAAVYAGGKHSIVATLQNSGFATLPDGVKVSFFNAETRKEIGSSYLNTALAPGESTDLILADVILNEKTGTTRIYAEVNPDRKVAELSTSNNRSREITFESLSPITISVDPLNPIYGITDEIEITGEVSSVVEGGNTIGVAVDVYIINDSYRKVVKVYSGTDGRFSTTFKPAQGQLGHFAVGACYPGTQTNVEMTGFDIVGLRRTSDAYIKVELSTNEPLRLLIPVENPSTVDIHNVRMRQLGIPENVSVSVEPVSVIHAGETYNLDVTITGTQPSPEVQWYPAVFAMDADEGSPLSLTIYEITRNTFGVLKAEEPVIRTTMNVHTSRTYPVTVTNTGRGETGRMTLSLPACLKTETPTTLPSIGPGESATIILKLAPTEETVANVPMNGQIAVNCENGHGVVIPFNITPVSALTGSLRVNVCDEYTYYTNDKPMVKDATVQVRNAYTNAVVAELNTGENGYVVFENIPEGYYTVTITADHHDSYRGNFIVNPGETREVEAFMTFQAITIEWEVEETEVEDEYTVVSTVRFETGVPKPVLIISVPKKFSLGDYYDNSRNLYYMSITNEGLITANDIELKLPPGTYTETDEYGGSMHAHFEWQDKPEPFSLAPKQTIQVPFYLVKGIFHDKKEDDTVIVDPAQQNCLRREPQMRAPGGGGGCICPFAASAAYKCASVNQIVEAMSSSNIGTCGDGGGGGIGGSSSSSSSGGGGGPGVPYSVIFASGSGKGSSGGSGESVGGCDSCAAESANNLIGCVVGFTPIGCTFGVISTVADIVEGNFDPFNWRSWGNLFLTAAGCVVSSLPLGTAIAAASCALSLSAPCSSDGGSGNAHAPLYRVPGLDGDVIDVSEEEYTEAAVGLYQDLIMNGETSAGTEAGAEVDDENGDGRLNAPGGPRHSYITPAYHGDFYRRFLKSAAGVMFTLWSSLDAIYREQFGSTEGGWAEMSHKEAADLLRLVMSAPEDTQFVPNDWMSVKPSKLSTEEFSRFIERINNTMLRRQGLPYDASNYINETIIQNAQKAIRDANVNLQELGYSDADELSKAVLKQHGILMERNKESVCASVVLKFEQSLVMTRQAFRGTLTVTNGHTTKPMTDVKLSLKITDQYGNVATSHEFQINPEKLTGFEGQLSLDAGWSLAAEAKGVANILFIPTRYAAPAEDVVYYFGGSLSYMDPFNDVEVTRQLQPVPMTVRPSAVLQMDYFLERVLYGDDPMTKDVVEPVVPGEFSLIINNVGLGDATNVNMTTKQPRIVENEKGLFIDFEITGATINGKESCAAFGESIVTPFGTIPAQRTAYAQWWLTSSLLGKFTEYEVEATHVTSYDNPDLSLLESVDIHPLTRSIIVDESGDRPEMGFLVDDYKDTEYTPDHIYLTTGEVSGVGPIESAKIVPAHPAGEPEETVLDYKLTVVPEFLGWTYGFVTDPTGGKQTVVRVVRVSDGRELPARNFWQTDRTVIEGEDPIAENRLHFCDYYTLTREEYIITFSPKPEVELEIADFGNVPDEGNFPDEQVKYVDVIFNKEIDPETFTLDDISFTVEGVKQDMSKVTLAPVTEGSTTTFRLTLDDSYSEQNGFYSITVQTAGITDCEGFQGATGKECHWVFLKDNIYHLNFVAPEGYTFNVEVYEPMLDNGHVQYYPSELKDDDGNIIPDDSYDNIIFNSYPSKLKLEYHPFEIENALRYVFSLSPITDYETHPEYKAIHEANKHMKAVYTIRRINDKLAQLGYYYPSERSEVYFNKKVYDHYDYPYNYHTIGSLQSDVDVTVDWEPNLDTRLAIDIDMSDVPSSVIGSNFAYNILPRLLNPQKALYQGGTTVKLEVEIPDDAVKVKWYQVKKAKMKEGEYYLGDNNPAVPDELEFLSSEPVLYYTLDKESYNKLSIDISFANGYHQDFTPILETEYCWVVLKYIYLQDEDNRFFPRGWQYISFNDESLDLNSFMSTCAGALTTICGEDNKTYTYFNGEWIGTPIDLEVGKSYRVFFDRPVFYKRLNAIRPIIEETPIELDEGWTNIGYTPVETLPVNEALKEYDGAKAEDVLKDYDNFAVYTEEKGWVGSMETMAPGVGYMYYTTDTDHKQFYYTADTQNAVDTSEQDSDPGQSQGQAPMRIVHGTYGEGGSAENPKPIYGAYPDNMTMIARVMNDSKTMTLNKDENYWFMAFVDDECRGVGKFVDDTRIFITIYGKDTPEEELPQSAPARGCKHAPDRTTPSLNCVDASKAMPLKLPLNDEVKFYISHPDDPYHLWEMNETQQFQLTPVGKYTDPQILTIGQELWTSIHELHSDRNLKMYSARRNPVEDRLYLIGLTDQIRSWMLVSVSGAMMAHGDSFDNTAGLDMSAYAPGHYLLHLDTSFGPQTVKVIKK